MRTDRIEKPPIWAVFIFLLFFFKLPSPSQADKTSTGKINQSVMQFKFHSEARTVARKGRRQKF